MELGFDLRTICIGVLVFLARVTDVSMGTMRTISIVQGRTKRAFVLGFVEISMWLVVISTVVSQITTHPVLGIFYAFGFSTGNVVGIMLEKKLAFGNIILRVISSEKGMLMAENIRAAGYAVTTFQGEGKNGPVLELYIVCRRRDFDTIVGKVRSIEPDAFYISEQAGCVSKIYRPSMQRATGWRAILKMK